MKKQKKRIENEICKFYSNPCIESECPCWKTNDWLPVSRKIPGSGWCTLYRKHIYFQYEED